MNDMLGINAARAPAGRFKLPGAFSQGIALLRSAPGFVLMALQAMP